MLPELDLPRLASTRVLLIGAGTLGCHIARDLLAWGVRHFTFIDSGKVSHSNPVRQPLFEFEDACDPPGGAYKAVAAAEGLKRIHPGVDARGVVLSIPMPGHPIPPAEKERAGETIRHLDELVRGHDVVFLLTDTRESRWLPTLLGAVHDKLTMTVGLGFDMYLVMRHGRGAGISPPPSIAKRLGCFFCNDTVAPQNSMVDRALDQQCTVTRPGVATQASSLAVEMLVALLHHPDGPSTSGADEMIPLTSRTPSPLGLVPHQIRGFLSHLTTLLATNHAFDKCPACSPTVTRAYLDAGVDFCFRACDDPTYLESITGLTQLHQEIEAAMEGLLDIDEDEDIEDDGEDEEGTPSGGDGDEAEE